VIRVLLDCRMASWSGVGRYTGGLARALAARADVELVQVCAGGEAPPVEPGFLVRAVTASAHPFRLSGALELGRIARAVSPDVVHCLHFATPMSQQAPLVITLHDLLPLVVPGVMPSLVKRIAYRMWNTRAVDSADALIVPSRTTATDVSRYFGAARDKLVVIAEAADDFASGCVGPLTGRLAELTSTPYLLSGGNIKPHKDLPTLFDAFAAIAPLSSSLRLLLTGPDPPGYLQAELAGSPAGVASRVCFTGQVNDAELRALYAGALAFVFPSRYEGFGLPPLEAMAMGAPVVCSQATSLPDVVGDAALVFPAGDRGALVEALRRVLRDPALRQGLKAAGHKQAERFTWSKTAARTVAVYAKVLHDREVSSAGWEGGSSLREREEDTQ
jgi:glycosyltransferase involved in cell wall biosynthesis